MAESRIEWTDKVWNPVTGCTRASAGCDNCYAVTMTKRLAAMGKEKYAGLVNEGKDHFNGKIKTHDDALPLPLSWKKPQRVFVNSMSDLFHKDVPFEFIDKVFAVMALCPQHTFQVLTKRPERMAEYFEEHYPDWDDAIAVLYSYSPLAERAYTDSTVFDIDQVACDAYNTILKGPWPTQNVWLGTSVEDQQTADERIPRLLKCPAAVRFLSCEPLLGAIDIRLNHAFGTELGLSDDPMAAHFLHRAIDEGLGDATPGIHWVICGGESGPNARPMHPDWARSLRDQCQAAGVPFFFKQWGEWQDGSDLNGPARDITILSNGEWAQFHTPEYKELTSKHGNDWNRLQATAMSCVGKKRAGRLLDGREWNEYPQTDIMAV